MPRRTRSQRIARRETSGDTPAPPPAPKPPRGAQHKPITYAGTFGGLLGVAGNAVMTVGFLLSDDRQFLAPVFAVLALLFVPAIAVSVRDHPRRQTVLRLSTALALVVGFAGFVADPAVPVLMGPPMVLLATGAGLIFQGSRR